MHTEGGNVNTNNMTQLNTYPSLPVETIYTSWYEPTRSTIEGPHHNDVSSIWDFLLND